MEAHMISKRYLRRLCGTLVSMCLTWGTLTDARTVTILAIDGGGIRGIIPAVIIDALEKKVWHESK